MEGRSKMDRKKRPNDREINGEDSLDTSEKAKRPPQSDISQKTLIRDQSMEADNPDHSEGKENLEGKESSEKLEGSESSKSPELQKDLEKDKSSKEKKSPNDGHLIHLLRKGLEKRGNSFFWKGTGDYSDIHYNFTPDTRNPEFQEVNDKDTFEFFGNQGSLHLQDVYYNVRKSLRGLNESRSNAPKNNNITYSTKEIIRDIENTKVKSDIEKIHDKVQLIIPSLPTNEKRERISIITNKLKEKLDEWISLPDKEEIDSKIADLIHLIKKIIGFKQSTKSIQQWHHWFSEFVEKNQESHKLMDELKKNFLITPDHRIL